MRSTAGLIRFLALALSTLLAALATVQAEEGYGLPPAEKLPPETAADVDDCDSDSATPACPTATTQSHRRHALKKQPAVDLAAAPVPAETDLAETPQERLQRLCSDGVVLQPIIVHSTLADAMRRVADWGEACPICGHAPSGSSHRPAQSTSEDGHKLSSRRAIKVGQPIETDDEPAAAPLRSGEPAQVILETRRRLGKSVLEGTEFGGSPEALIRWIRILDEENRRQQAILDEKLANEPGPVADVNYLPGQAAEANSQVEALRLACRQLQEAADLLEDQNLFESADTIRGYADHLRRQARQKTAASVASGDESPLRAARSK